MSFPIYVKRYAGPLALATLLSGWMACRSTSDQSKESTNGTVTNTRALSVSCLKGDNYRLDEGSVIQWQIGKLVKGNPGGLLVDGTLGVDGLWNFNSESLQASQADFSFDPTTVKSDAELRDTRLKTFFFLMPQNLPAKLSVKLWEAKIGTLKEGETAEVLALGKLIIAGHQSNVLKLPLTIVKKDGVIFVKTKSAIRLNLRSDEAGNGIDMSDRINELLTQVPGVSLYDYTDITFDLTLKPFPC